LRTKEYSQTIIGISKRCMIWIYTTTLRFHYSYRSCIVNTEYLQYSVFSICIHNPKTVDTIEVGIKNKGCLLFPLFYQCLSSQNEFWKTSWKIPLCVLVFHLKINSMCVVCMYVCAQRKSFIEKCYPFFNFLLTVLFSCFRKDFIFFVK
jgi:hypothetical protein